MADAQSLTALYIGAPVGISATMDAARWGAGEALVLGLRRSVRPSGRDVHSPLPLLTVRLFSLLLICTFLILVTPGAGGAQPSTVILVRHAERGTAPAGDPVLTEAGMQRAAELATALAGARVTSVVTTHLQRTQLTAKSVLEGGRAHIIVRAGGPLQAHVDSVVAAVRRQESGAVVLVVGHSNTIPPIIATLGGPTLPDLCENQYSSMFILEYPAGGGPPRFIKAKYGAADPPGSESCERMR